MADEDLRGVTLSAGEYIRALAPSGDSPFARPFSLVRPPCDRQYRTARLKAERMKRRAERRAAEALEEGGSVRGVDVAELARLWTSFTFRELRRDLSPQEAEKLHRLLAGYLSRQVPPEVWHAAIFALREARRAAEIPIGAPPRKWRQSFPDLNDW